MVTRNPSLGALLGAGVTTDSGASHGPNLYWLGVLCVERGAIIITCTRACKSFLQLIHI